jgi:hypothetical protein
VYSKVFAEEIERLNSTCLQNLFLKFFEYYLYEFNFINKIAAISSIVPGRPDPNNGNVWDKQELFTRPDDSSIDWRTMRRRTWLSISDPFEINRFLGTTARGTEIMIKEMRRAVDLLSNGNINELFEIFKRQKQTDGIHVPIRALSKRDIFLQNLLIPLPTNSFNRCLHLTSIQFCNDMVSFLDSIILELKRIDGGRRKISLNEIRSIMSLTHIGLIPESSFKSLSVSFNDGGSLSHVELGKAVKALRDHLDRLKMQDASSSGASIGHRPPPHAPNRPASAHASNRQEPSHVSSRQAPPHAWSRQASAHASNRQGPPPPHASNRQEPSHASSRQAPPHASNRQEPPHLSNKSAPQHAPNSRGPAPPHVSSRQAPPHASKRPTPAHASHSRGQPPQLPASDTRGLQTAEGRRNQSHGDSPLPQSQAMVDIMRMLKGHTQNKTDSRGNRKQQTTRE